MTTQDGAAEVPRRTCFFTSPPMRYQHPNAACRRVACWARRGSPFVPPPPSPPLLRSWEMVSLDTPLELSAVFSATEQRAPPVCPPPFLSLLLPIHFFLVLRPRVALCLARGGAACVHPSELRQLKVLCPRSSLCTDLPVQTLCYCVQVPLSADGGWSASPSLTFLTPATPGELMLLMYVRDARGAVSLPVQTPITVQPLPSSQVRSNPPTPRVRHPVPGARCPACRIAYCGLISIPVPSTCTCTYPRTCTRTCPLCRYLPLRMRLRITSPVSHAQYHTPSITYPITHYHTLGIAPKTAHPISQL